MPLPPSSAVFFAGKLATPRAEWRDDLQLQGIPVVGSLKSEALTHIVCGDGIPMGQQRRIEASPAVKLSEQELYDLLFGEPESKKQRVEPVRIESPPPEEPVAVSSLLWVDKYAPKSAADIIGNKKAIARIQTWLMEWKNGVPRKKDAILLVGNAGLGKTSCATVLAKEAGYQVVEMNASDVRNKAAVEEVLYDVANSYAMTPDGRVLKMPNLIVMDEVDGMSAGDRGGAAALIDVIKRTKAPVICICNDKYASALKSLKSHCEIIDFWPPYLSECLARVESICAAEVLEIERPVLKKIIEECNSDMRSIINRLYMLSLTKQNMLEQMQFVDGARADRDVNVFSGLKELMEKRTTLARRDDLFYANSDLFPLFVQENYLRASKDVSKVAEASDSISLGDVANEQIYGHQAFALLPTYGTLSTVIPSSLVAGGLSDRVQFPASLGKTSSIKKKAGEMRALCRKVGIGVEEAAYFRDILVASTVNVDDTVELLSELDLERDDFDQFMDCGTSKVKIDAKKKAALTRKMKAR